MRKSAVYDLVVASMFSVVIAICAWITIPFAVPFTMQTFGVFLAIAVLGGKLAAVSILLYILLGVIGIPVFSGFQSGIGVLFQQTGGYVIGFLIASLVIWGVESCTRKFGWCCEKVGSLQGRKIVKKYDGVLSGLASNKKTWVLASKLLLGLLVCYTFGTLWFWILYMKNSGAISIGAVIGICVVPFVVPDLVKIMLVLVVQKRLRRSGFANASE